MGVLGKIAAAAKSAARNSAVAVAYRDGLMFGDDEVVSEGVTVYRDGRPMSEKELMEARAAAEPREPLIDWRPLTKAGKLPKCVVRATAVWDRQNGDCVIAHLGYTADARPYTADVHIWTAGERYSYKIRTVGGEIVVTGEGPA